MLSRNIATRTYTVDAPVCTPLSDFLATPDRGTGIYNRCVMDAGGNHPGQAKSHSVTITRNTGPAGNLNHQLRWIGNDGNFSSVESVVLPRNVPVQVVVRAQPSAGAHGALLRIDDPSTAAVDAETMATVVAGTAPAALAYAFSRQSAVDRNLYKSYFVTVPEGARALWAYPTIATGRRPVHRDQPVGRPGGEHGEHRVLHQLLRRGSLQPALPRTRTRCPACGRSRSRGAPRRR